MGRAWTACVEGCCTAGEEEHVKCSGAGMYYFSSSC